MNAEYIVRDAVVNAFESNPELWLVLLGMVIMSYLLPSRKRR